MIEAAKTRIKRHAIRASISLNAFVLVLGFIAYGLTSTGHARGSIELPGFSFGGGTQQQEAAAERLDKLADALPTQVAAHEQAPLPGRKPAIK